VIHVLFPLGIRLSTILMAVAFVVLAVVRRDKLPLIAGWLWVTTFEAAFQISSLIMGRLPLGLFTPVFFLALAAVTLALTRGKVKPDWRYLGASLVVLGVWMATGFHLNGHQHGLFSLHTRIPNLDAMAEILNVTAKTLWGLGFFLPLLRRTTTDELDAADRPGVVIGHGAGAPAPRGRFGSAAAPNPVTAHAHIREEQQDEESGEDDVQDHRASRTI
jgi:hypothetical protein